MSFSNRLINYFFLLSDYIFSFISYFVLNEMIKTHSWHSIFIYFFQMYRQRPTLTAWLQMDRKAAKLLLSIHKKQFVLQQRLFLFLYISKNFRHVPTFL